MSKIIKLDKNLANQIAAWEVVERPISVVKELIENSIDAWATEVKIEIEGWWIEKIIITDNWEWIKKDDLELALEKYSTSKIKSLEDLYNVMTFWFRWEALASISSVSKFEIISKTNDSKCAYSLKSQAWEVSEVKESGWNTWTKIIIEDLFFNTPARLNYLKTNRTEFNHIHDFINNISLCYPSVWFELISDSRNIFKYNKNEEIETRIYSIYWETFLDSLLKLNFNFSGLEIIWYITNPKISFSNKKKQTIFVNNRVINSPIIYRAIMNAYNRFIPHNSFPWFILNIKIDPTQVDVNVHPRKQEVRFANEKTIFSWIYHAIEDKLNSVSLINLSEQDINDVENKSVSWFQKWTNHEKQWFNLRNWETKNYYTWSWTKFKEYSPYKDIQSNPNQSRINEAIDFSKGLLWRKWYENEVNIEKSTDLHDTPVWKIIWQAYNSYIIVETQNWLKLIDQHAVAERVIYEKLVKNKYTTNIQRLLIPESFNLVPKEIDILEKSIDVFKTMWFDFEIMSSKIVILNWIPDFIKKENLEKIFLWILEDIWEEKFSKSKTLEEVKNKIYAYTACRSAVKFWNKLNLFEMNKLLNDSILDYSSTCPHWRPVIFEIWLDELKGKYER